jgi:hypothetical protein
MFTDFPRHVPTALGTPIGFPLWDFLLFRRLGLLTARLALEHAGPLRTLHQTCDPLKNLDSFVARFRATFVIRK